MTENNNQDLTSAFTFVDSLSEERVSRFDKMTKAEIKTERLKKKGLIDEKESDSVILP